MLIDEPEQSDNMRVKFSVVYFFVQNRKDTHTRRAVEVVLSTYQYHRGSIQVEDKQNAKVQSRDNNENIERKKERKT